MKELRFLQKVELRAGSSSAGKTLTGYAARFNVLSHDLGGFREKIFPGAFSKALRSGQDVKLLINHDPNHILGRIQNKTLALQEDTIGLRFTAQLPNTTDGNDVYELVKRGDLGDCSFAFTADEQMWGEEPDPDNNSLRCQVRTLVAVRLFDVSVVTSPAYPKTSVGVRDRIAEVSDPDSDMYDPDDPDFDPEYASRTPLFNSIRSLWPEGIPAEVRSHCPALRHSNNDGSARRKASTNKILSL